MANRSLLINAGGRSSTPTLRELYPTEEAYNLAVQQRRLQNQRDVYQALGITPEEVGQSQGFLSGVLDYSTRPQSALLGFLSGIAGRTQAGEETNPLLRAAAALTGRERYRGSDLFGELPEEAGLPLRAARGALGFGIDVATDPLSYLTFGSGGVLRGAGRAVAAGTAVERAVPKIISAAAPQRVAPVTTGIGTATQAALERARGGIQLISGARKTPVAAAQRPATLLSTETPITAAATAPRVAAPALETAAPVVAPRPATDDLAKRLGLIAGEQMALGGPRAVLRSLRTELQTAGYSTQQARTLANRILAATPSEVRGGVGVGIPFTSKRVTVATAGLVEDAPALKAAADFSRKIFNNYRKGPVYQKWAETMNGRVIGPAYAAVLRGAEGGTDSPLKWEEFLKLNAIDKRSKALAVNMGEENSALLRASQKAIEKDKEAKQAFENYYDMRDRMVLNPNATQSEQNGYEAAKNLYDFHQAQYNEAYEIAQRLGIELGNLDDYGYMARPFTEEGRQWFRNRGYNPNEEYDPAKVRRAFIELIDGDIRALSNKEINQRVGIKIFEEDPLKLAQHTMAYTVNLLSNLRFLEDLSNASLVTKLEKGSREFVNVPAFARKRTLALQQIDQVINRIKEELANPNLKSSDAKYIKLSTAMKKLAENKEVIQTVLANIDSSNPEDLAKVKTLVDLIKASYKTTKYAKVPYGKLRELTDISGLTRELTGFEDISVLKAQGVVPLLSGELVEKKLVRLPRGFSEFGAAEEVRNAVQRLYTLDVGKGIKEYQTFVENVYMPYYQLFKTHATITRGPGYHIRNLIGGLLNNNLANITVAEHILSAKMDKVMFDSTRKAQKALDSVMAGRPSGLPADQDALAQALADTLKRRNAAASDLEYDQLGKLIGIQELDKIKIGNHTAADILIAATDNGVLRGNKTLEALRTDRGAESVEALSDRLSDPKYINVFQNKSREDLNKGQKFFNWTMNNTWVSLQGDIAEHSENFLRMAGFINGVKRYGLEDGGFAASMIPKATQFDYADLSQFERRALKNVIPFYTWMRNNVPLQFNALFSQPGKFNRLIYAQNALATGRGAPGDDPNLATFVPEYMRARFGVLTDSELGGTPTIVGLETPAVDINQLLAFGGPGAQWSMAAPQIVRAINPLAKTAVETLTGRNLTFGTPIEGAGETAMAAARGSIPFLGLGERLFQAGARGVGLPFGKEFFPGEPVGANIVRDIGGLPVSGFTPRQQYAEMRRQEERVRNVIGSRTEPGIVDRLLGARGVDVNWLQSMLDMGYSPEQISRAIEQGAGRPTTQG